VTDALGRFPHHAHLCCLPLALDLHGLVARDHAAVPVADASAAALASAGRPYVYVVASGTRAVYLARSTEGDRSLEQIRLKPRIAEVLRLSGRGDWRAYPGDEELDRVIDRFAGHRATDGVG